MGGKNHCITKETRAASRRNAKKPGRDDHKVASSDKKVGDIYAIRRLGYKD